MYRAVIISCLIAVVCAGTVSPGYYANRETRQATTAATVTGFDDSKPSFIASLKPYVRTWVGYGLKALGAVFFTTSAVGLFCHFTTVCETVYLKLATSELSGGRRRRMANSYSPNEYPYLDELTEILMRAMDNYVNTANVKQKREVGQ